MLLPEFPKRIEIELASSCNLRCTYCPRHFVDGLGGFIDLSFFKRLIDEIEPHPETVLVLHRRGESLLHPDFIEIMDYIRGKFQTVQLATNATLLDKEKAQAIIESISFLSFSIDTPDIFEKTRIPAKYEKVESNIMQFLYLNSQHGNKVKTQVSMVQTANTSQEEADLFKEYWHGKVDRIRIYAEHSSNGHFGSLKNKRIDRKPCVMPFYEMLIYCDGKTGRCNHDWDGEPIGDVNQNTISEIWFDGRYQNLRDQHISLKIVDSVCAACDSWYPEEGSQGTGEVIEK